jgi:phosphatidylglycerophosphate synthase
LGPDAESVEVVRRSYPAEKRWEELSGELPALLIFRPLSFLVTPLFLRAGLSANAVSCLGGALAVAMFAVAWRGGAHAHWAVFALGFAVQLLDCVDGNVARVRREVSARGQFLDLLVGQLYGILLLASLGLLVEQAGGGPLAAAGLEIALALALLVCVNRLTRNQAQLHFGYQQLSQGPPAGPLSLPTRLLIALAGLENLYIFAIAIGGALGALQAVLLGIAAYVVGAFLYVELELWRALRNR